MSTHRQSPPAVSACHREVSRHIPPGTGPANCHYQLTTRAATANHAPAHRPPSAFRSSTPALPPSPPAEGPGEIPPPSSPAAPAPSNQPGYLSCANMIPRRACWQLERCRCPHLPILCLVIRLLLCISNLLT